MAAIFVANFLPRFALSSYISQERTQDLKDASDIAHIFISTSLALTAAYIYFVGKYTFLYPLPLGVSIIEWLHVIDHPNSGYYTALELLFSIIFMMYYIDANFSRNKLLYLMILGIILMFLIIIVLTYFDYISDDVTNITLNAINSLGINIFLNFLVV